MAKSLSAPKKGGSSTQLASYNSTGRTIGKNKTGKAVKAVGLVKAAKSKKGI